MTDKMTAIERLENLLDQKDRELQAFRKEAEFQEYREKWAWMRQQKSDEADGLPVPRLEIRWRQADEWTRLAEYSMVARHFMGDVIRHPISVTKCSGTGALVHEGKVETPFRDGTHIRHDMRHLGLPGFVIANGVVTKLEPMDGPAPYEKP